MMMMSNGGGGGNSNVDGDHHQQQQDDEEFKKRFPIGYRFDPKDEELIEYYLYRKVKKLQLPPNLIKDVNIYAFNPWDLADRYRSYGDNIFYFFSPRERKYRNGKRPNRAAGGGYWKASGSDKPIVDENTNIKIGYKRVLVFYKGRPPKADSNKHEILRENKTDWLMHEYTLNKLKDEEKDEKTSSSNTITGSTNRKNKRPCTDHVGSPNHYQLDEYVLCKLYLKRSKSTKDVARPSIATAASSSAPAATAVSENHHQIHGTAGVAGAVAVVADHQYPLTSMVEASAAEEMMPQNHHFMCPTDVDAVAAAADHQYLISMVSAAMQEDMMPLNYNCDNIHPSSAALSSSAAMQEELMPLNYNCDNINPSSAAPSSLVILPSVNHGELTQQQLKDLHSMFIAETNNIRLRSNFLAGFSVPNLRTHIGPR